MRILSFIIWSFLLFLIGTVTEESPHGKDFKISCNKCHSANSWELDKKIYSFDHSATKMPLTGQHKEVNCKSCHQSLIFSEAKQKNECKSCHSDIHSNTVGTNCDKCHTSETWLVTNITSIHQQSRFPLLGVHSNTDCQKCHKSESLHRYDVSGIECIDCHRENYLAASNPNHVSSGISTECSQCHNIYALNWGGAGFNHSKFPLNAGHSNVSCSKCHKNNNYTNTPTECYACHQGNYNSATNPVHVGGCYSTNCLLCHSTNPDWKPSTFQHNNYFSLTLGHANVSCAKCHINNNCNPPTNCYACHQQNYNSTTNPVHSPGCYSTDCTKCHTTIPGWKPTSFNHNIYFPITSGKHKNISCAECHTNPANCTFSCIDCHEHNQASMNSEHGGVSAYSWNSQKCYQCHPTGQDK